MRLNPLFITPLFALALAWGASAHEIDWSQFPKPPAPNSARETAELATLLDAQAKRTEAQCALAVAAQSSQAYDLFGSPNARGAVITGREMTASLSILLYGQSRVFREVFELQMRFQRARPFDREPRLKPCGGVLSHESGYPDGDAALVEVYASILAELFPDRADEFQARAEAIAQDRVVTGLYFPSDARAGLQVGQIIYSALKSEVEYGNELKRVRRQLGELIIDWAKFPPAPAVNSKVDQADMATMCELENTRTQTQCELAKTEEKTHGAEWWGDKAPRGPALSPDEVEATREVLDYAFDQATTGAAKVKLKYVRLRPFQRDPSLSTCITRPRDTSYPSAHAAAVSAEAQVLCEVLPDKCKRFTERGHALAYDRVIGGVHFPSDVAAGELMGAQWIYPALQKDAKYRELVARTKLLLATPGVRYVVPAGRPSSSTGGSPAPTKPAVPVRVVRFGGPA